MDDIHWDDFDEPYRKCELDDISYYEDYGTTCDQCDIWICNNCWPYHIEEHLQNENTKTTKESISTKTSI